MTYPNRGCLAALCFAVLFWGGLWWAFWPEGSTPEMEVAAASEVDPTDVATPADVTPLSHKLMASRWDCTVESCADSADIERIGRELEWQARRRGLDAGLLAAVMMVEDPWLDTLVVSSAGAIGLMQVMPFHAGNWAGCGPNLYTVEDNICTGAAILAFILESELMKAEWRSLQRYNGCTCDSYPTLVAEALGDLS